MEKVPASIVSAIDAAVKKIPSRTSGEYFFINCAEKIAKKEKKKIKKIRNEKIFPKIFADFLGNFDISRTAIEKSPASAKIPKNAKNS